MNPLNCIDRVYAERLDWAYKARNSLIQGLKTNYAKELYANRSAGGVNIAVYGPAQVGKTSLILKLLGIKDEVYENVYAVLRAGVKEGSSVTKTAMLYLPSDDEYYCYIDGSGACRGDEEMIMSKLKVLRDEVNHGLVDPSDVVKILIPKAFFDDRDNTVVRIVDIPGYESHDTKEHPHVRRVLNNILMLVSIVVLVNRAQHFTDLRPSTMGVIGDWLKYSNKCRIVLTYSITPRSEKKAKRESAIDEREYVESYRSPLEETIGLKIPEQVVYPLEFGDSWVNAKSSNRDLYDRYEPIMVSLIEKMRNDILKSTQEEALFWQEQNYWKEIEGCYQRVKTRMIVAAETHRTKIHEMKVEVNDLYIDLEKHQRREKKIKHELKNTPLPKKLRKRIVCYDEVWDASNLYNLIVIEGNRYNETLNKYISDYREVCGLGGGYSRKERLHLSRTSWYKAHMHMLSTRISYHIGVRPKLGIVYRNRENDIEETSNIMSSIFNKAKSRYSRACSDATGERDRLLRKDERKVLKRIKDIERRIRDKEKVINRERASIASECADDRLEMQRLSEDNETVYKYRELMYCEYRVKNDNIRLLLDESTTDRWARLAALLRWMMHVKVLINIERTEEYG